MPNRAKRAAARQSQLGQRRRKERKERGTPHLQETTVAEPSQPPTSTPISVQPVSESATLPTPVSAVRADRGTLPAQPHLRSDLTRIAMVAVLSTTIVVVSAVIL